MKYVGFVLMAVKNYLFNVLRKFYIILGNECQNGKCISCKDLNTHFFENDLCTDCASAKSKVMLAGKPC